MFGPEYHKINGVFKRDEKGVILPDEFSQPEFEYLLGTPWRWTEKVDGTNIRLHWNGAKVTIGGRTDRAQIPSKLVQALEPLLDLEKWSKVFGFESATVYGEGYGAGIQKGGGNYRQDQGFILFDVRVGEWWLRDDDVSGVADALGFDAVPVVGVFPLRSALIRVELGNVESRWPGVSPEGIVGRPAADLFDRSGRRIITKIKAKDYADYRRAQEAAA